MIWDGHFNYYAAQLLICFGIFVMIAAGNYVRKIIGMVLLQTGVILFYVTVSYKSGSHIPVVHEDPLHAINPALFANPLPHALMLTAIVVGVSTLGVALALAVSIYREHRTLEEDELLKKQGPAR